MNTDYNMPLMGGSVDVLNKTDTAPTTTQPTKLQETLAKVAPATTAKTGLVSQLILKFKNPPPAELPTKALFTAGSNSRTANTTNKTAITGPLASAESHAPKMPTTSRTGSVITVGPATAEFKMSTHTMDGVSETAPITQAQSKAKIPGDAFKVLSDWHEKIKDNAQFSPYHAKGTELGKRIDYAKDEKTFKAFEATFKEMGCNFHKMKAAYQSGDAKVGKPEMQMLCDLRAAYFETKLFPAVMKEFPGLKDPSTNSSGSVEITSDWDPPFKIGEDSQVRETKAVKFFNEEFRKSFGEEAGLVFDTNAYSNQYTREASTSDWQMKYANLQEKISTTMAAMTMPKEIFDDLHSKIAEKITDPNAKTAFNEKLDSVRADADNLKARLNKEMIKVAVDAGIPLGDLEKDYNANIGTKENQWCLEPAVEKFFHKIENNGTDQFEHMKRLAKNQLHETIKTSYEDLELQRSALMNKISGLKTLATNPPSAGNAVLFSFKLNATFLNHIEILNQKKIENEKYGVADTAIDTFIGKLKGAAERVTNTKDPQKLVEAFITKQKFDTTIKDLEKQRAFLESAPAVYKQLEGKITKLNQQTNIADLQKNLGQLGELEKEKAALEGKYGKGLATLTDAKREVENQLTKQQAARKDANNANFSLVGLLDHEADRLMVSMDQVQTTGMIFADEAHASADAFNRVVLGIQVGQKTVFPIQKEMNALREILSFGFDHMHHHSHGPHGESMLANGAKYMDRVFTVLDIVNERAGALGLKPVEFNKEINAAGLRTFMTKLAPDRAKTPKELAPICLNLAKQAGFETFDKATADSIVGKLKDLCATMLAWGEGLPDDKKNAVYAAVT